MYSINTCYLVKRKIFCQAGHVIMCPQKNNEENFKDEKLVHNKYMT